MKFFLGDFKMSYAKVSLNDRPRWNFLILEQSQIESTAQEMAH